MVSRSDVATPLRELVGKQDNVQVLLGEVTTVNPEGKQIVFNGKAYSYDHLILATGSGSTYFGHEDWRTFAPPDENPRARRGNTPPSADGDGAGGADSEPRGTPVSADGGDR